MEITKKTVIVLFSGGLDSTFVLVRSLEEGHHVYPVYVDTAISDAQKKLELQQGAKIVDVLGRRFQDLDWRRVVKIDVNGSTSRIVLNQPPVWMYGALLALGSVPCDVDEVRLAYVPGDQAFAYADEIRALWKALCGFLSPDYRNGGPEVVFPASKWMKHMEVEYLKERGFRDVFLETTWCEDPVEHDDGSFSTCDECSSCRAMKMNGMTATKTYTKYSRPKKSYEETYYDEGNDEPVDVAVRGLTLVALKSEKRPRKKKSAAEDVVYVERKTRGRAKKTTLTP